MGRIFAGLVKCGAWGCFDEFNRLDEEVLSAVSQQIQVIQAALKDRAPNLELLGKVIDLDPAAGVSKQNELNFSLLSFIFNIYSLH